jgi:hypothetical protein
MLKTRTTNSLKGSLLFLLALLCTMLPVYANVSEDVAMTNLQSYVYKAISGNSYGLEAGGSVSGSDILVLDQTGGTTRYTMNETQFTELSKSAQEDFVNDIARYSEEAVYVAEDGTGTSVEGVTNSTVQNWWQQLQTVDGVGTKFLNVILEGTKPDFVTAKKIYSPFDNVVAVILALIAILIMALLGVVMGADIAYIVLPPFRLFVTEKDESEGGKIPVSKLISHAALSAVKEGEGEESKQVLGIYLKRRIIMICLLAICLMYLVQGQIYTFVGWVLDLMNGFLNF